MKTNHIINFWLISLSLALMTACQDDNLIENVDNPTVGKDEIALHVRMGNYDNPETRAQVQLGNNNEENEFFLWNEGDSFTLYSQIDSSVSSIFTISGYDEENPTAEAVFVGKNEFTDGSNVTAIYPQQETAGEGSVTFILPESEMSDGGEADWKNYMSKSMYMYANAVMEGSNTKLVFNHLCAMIRVSHTNTTGSEQILTDVAFTGSGNYFGTEAQYSFADKMRTTLSTTSNLVHTFSTFMVASGNTVDIYYLFFPGEDASNGTLSIRINDEEISMSLSDMGVLSFEAGKCYWFNTAQTDEGLIWKKDVPAVITNLPLIEAIETYYSTYYPGQVEFVKNEKGFLNVADNQEAIDSVKDISIYYETKIENLDGLEYFTNVEYLNLPNLGLTALDVSKLTNLRRLVCSNNPIKRLDVSANRKLEYLDCQNTELTELDVRNNLNLTHLKCGENPIKNLDVSNNTKLNWLEMSCSPDPNFSTLVTSIDVSNNLELTHLDVGNCSLITEIDVSQNTKLQHLSVQFTSISSLDVSKNAALTYLNCLTTENLSSVDLSNNKLLEQFSISGPSMAKIDLTNQPSLYYLWISGPITELDVSKNPLLTDLDCSRTEIAELDLSNNPLLRNLDCGSTNISELNLNNLTSLSWLDCSDTAIETLDLSKIENLVNLKCYGCHLRELDITNNSNISDLFCGKQTDESGKEINMTLYLTTDQKLNLWDKENLELDVNNANVTVGIKEVGDAN